MVAGKIGERRLAGTPGPKNADNDALSRVEGEQMVGKRSCKLRASEDVFFGCTNRIVGGDSAGASPVLCPRCRCSDIAPYVTRTALPLTDS